METLQQAIEKVVETIPALFFERLISKKLEAQGITATKKLSKRLAHHILSRTNEPFTYRSRKHSGHISLSIDKTETDEMLSAVKSFCETQLPRIVPDTAHRASKIVLQRLGRLGPMSTLLKTLNWLASATDWRIDGVNRLASCGCCSRSPVNGVRERTTLSLLEGIRGRGFERF
jgi:hypothetical protein